MLFACVLAKGGPEWKAIVKLVSSAAALAVALVLGSEVSPAFADEPPRPAAPPSGKLEEDRGPVRQMPGKLDEDRGSLGGGALPQLPPPTPPAAPPPAYSPAPPGYGPAPQGYGPPGYGPPGAAPQGYPQGYAPPGYPPAPVYAPPSYYPAPASPPPGYSMPPGYGGVAVEGGDIRIGRGRVYGEVESPERDAKKQRRASTGLIIAGVSSFGIGWLGASLHGLTMDLVGTSEYRAIFVPVVGPVVEAMTHRGAFTSGEKIGLVFEGVLQIGGLASFVVGMAVKPSKVSVGSVPVTVAVAPAVTDRGATMGLVGSF